MMIYAVHMVQRSRTFYLVRLAPKTRKTYSAPAKSYIIHCALHGIQPAFPATCHLLADWVAQLGVKRVKAKTIKSYLTAVRSAHVDMLHHDLTVFHAPELEHMIAGIRRLHGEAGTQERRPITKGLLLQMLPHLDQKSREGATFYAVFSLAFAAFLRVGEFTYTSNDHGLSDVCKWFLTRRSIELFNDHLDLTLPASKTDPFRRRITLHISASDDRACPVKVLRRLFRWRAFPDSLLFETADGFTRELVISQLREILTLLGFRGHYSGHSFRRGAATSAREAGLADNEIMLLGRWKSEAYRRYIDTRPERILAASRRHQQHRPRQR